MRTALALAMFVSFIGGCSADKPRVSPSDRSWSTGTVNITPSESNGDLGVRVEGRWPEGGDGLWIRYELRLSQSGSPDVFMVGGTNRLTDFQKVGTGVSDYSRASEFVRKIDRTMPYRAVFDYEIWKGEPAKGELLAKNSVWSPEIATRGPR